MHTSTFVRRNYIAFIILLVVLFGATVAIASIISGLSTTGSSTNVTITNLTIAKPADVDQGEVMIASVALHDGNATSVTPPSGWTQILRTDYDTNIGIVSFWKAAGASEPANYTWTLSPQTRAQGGITTYSGVDTSNPIDAAAGNFNRSKIATTSPITTTDANEEVVALFALHVGSNNFAGDFFSAPSGMTEKYDGSNTTAGPTVASFGAIQVAAGVAGSKSSTISGNPNQQRDWVSQQIALRRVPATTLSSGLISYWKFDESSGDAADASGNGKTLTNNNAATFASGKINNGTQLVRANSQYFSRTNGGYYDVTAGTVSCWVKYDSNPSVLSIVDTSVNSGVAGLVFRLNENNQIHLAFGGAVPSAMGATSLAAGAFSMVTGTWNTSRKEVFLNGVSDGADETDATMTAGNSIFKIGTRADFIENFDGTIDECGIWNRVLTQSELTELYNGGAGLQHPF